MLQDQPGPLDLHQGLESIQELTHRVWEELFAYSLHVALAFRHVGQQDLCLVSSLSQTGLELSFGG